MPIPGGPALAGGDDRGADRPELVTPLVLRDVCQLDYAEIADNLGIASGTPKSRIHAARQHVRASLYPARPALADVKDGITQAVGQLAVPAVSGSATGRRCRWCQRWPGSSRRG
jgi:Sigma-70, region 4